MTEINTKIVLIISEIIILLIFDIYLNEKNMAFIKITLTAQHKYVFNNL